MNASKAVSVYKAIKDVTGITSAELENMTTERKIHYIESTISSLTTSCRKNNSSKNKLRALKNTMNYLTEEKARLILTLNL